MKQGIRDKQRPHLKHVCKEWLAAGWRASSISARDKARRHIGGYCKTQGIDDDASDEGAVLEKKRGDQTSDVI